MKVLFASMRMVFLLGFALMQGVAPIAHAHVNGQNFDGHPHLEIEGMHVHPAHADGTNAVYIELDHSMVVTLPPEHRCKEVKFLPVFSAGVQAAASFGQPVLRVTLSDAAPEFPGFSCLPPHSQAPPAHLPV